MPAELPFDEARAWLTLLRVPGLGPAGIRELLGRHGDAHAALSATQHKWQDAPAATLIDGDLRWLDAPDHHLLVCTSEDFPALLRDIPSAPVALFVVGEPNVLWAPQIAVVGSRAASSAGLANARTFASAFARAGNVVTSGLAEGVDGAAHEGALDGGGKTIAVLGTGPDIIYPRRHRALAERIAAHGALVSEFPPGTPGKPEFFPRRNRIIAGLSLGTLVIEANLQSGSLITARLAAEQGREVFALPGAIQNPLARGCHKLIRDGAKLVESAEQVLEDLHGLGGTLAESLRQRLQGASLAPATPALAYDPDYLRLLAALDGGACALDELVMRTQLSAAALSSMLLVLELDGAAACENGRYLRC
jgi:DNA processing protein